jgi:hypothetical protein
MSPNDRDAHRELPRRLRRAVAHVRRETPPAAAQARALERARRLPRPRRRFRRDLLAVAGLAAALLAGFLLWGNRLAPTPATPEDRVASTDRSRKASGAEDGTSNTLLFLERDARELDRLTTLISNQERIRARTELIGGLLYERDDRDGFGGRSGGTTSLGTGSNGGNGLDGRVPTGTVDAKRLREPADPTVPAPPALPTVEQEEALRQLADREKLKESDAEKTVRLARVWGELPEKERKKALDDLVRDLPADRKEGIRNFFGKLDDRVARRDPGDKGPAVWHRDAAQPTVARVYVGDGNALELVSLQVTVLVEGSRARTLVDHVFRNPHDRQLEGTFEYPLPTGASPAYFAMFVGQSRESPPPRFVRQGEAPALPADALARLEPEQLVKQIDSADWGQLHVARVVPPDDGKEAYEETTRRRIDPALLEYAGGNTFRGRVFPIPPRGYNRVLISYEETLPFSGGRQVYRYPLPGVPVTEMSVAVSANAAECLEPTWNLKDGSRSESNGRLTLSRTWKGEKPTGEVVFAAAPPRPDVQVLSGRTSDGAPPYVHVRLRPHLPEERKWPFAQHAVFLLDTSASERPDRFAVSMKLLQAILEGDPDIKSFDVLTFSVGAAWLSPKGWLPNTPEGRKAALDRLDGLVLEGATDLGAALDRVGRTGLPAGTPVNCFLLSDGNLTWGDTDAPSLVARFEKKCPLKCRFHCYRTGLGAENAELFEALTRQGGGVFQCYGEDEVKAAAQAHRHECLNVERVRFVGGPEASDVLVAGRKAAVYPGGELIVAARLADAGRTTLVVEGTFQGAKVAHEFPIEARGDGELAPRGWAEVAVASLLSLNDPKLDGLATAYCQKFGIGSRVASFLVLENASDYKRFNLEKEREALPGDLGKSLETLWLTLGQEAAPGVEYRRFLDRIEPRVKVLGGPQGDHVRRLLDALSDEDYAVAASPDGSLPLRSAAGPEYLAALEKDRRAVEPYLAEARHRLDAGDRAGAVRVLSTVIEEHPGRSDALRLVGYRLLDMKRPGEAALLFRQVQRQRPFEPHSYRDLARSLEEGEKYGLAAVNYEIVLSGTWHSRFRDDLKTVVREEYAAMMQEALRTGKVKGKLADLFGERLEAMKDPSPASDLRVSISWNTDSTDVDLWVIEPDGEKCMYNHNRTKNGGELSQDQTQGYGPERYRIGKAAPGEYAVVVDYFAANPNLLGGETHVQVVITRFAGTPRETTERKTVILKKAKEQVEVCRVKF